MSIDQSINLLQNIKLYNFVTGGQRPPRIVNWTVVLPVVLVSLSVRKTVQTHICEYSHICGSCASHLWDFLENFKIFTKKKVGKIQAFLSNLGTEIKTLKNLTDSEILKYLWSHQHLFSYERRYSHVWDSRHRCEYRGCTYANIPKSWWLSHVNTLNLICEKGESIQEDGSVAEADLLGKHLT